MALMKHLENSSMIWQDADVRQVLQRKHEAEV